MNLARARHLNVVPLTGTWCRAVRHQHFGTALAYSHSVTSPTRFNPGSGYRPTFPILYFAENHQLCLFEVSTLIGSPLAGQPVLPNPGAGPWTVFAVRVQLNRVVDLCDVSQLQIIESSVQELTGDWRGYAARSIGGQPQTSPTQQLGATLYARLKVEGLLTYSAKDPTCRNLVVFPTRLRANSLVELIDPATGNGHQLTAGGTLTPIP